MITFILFGMALTVPNSGHTARYHHHPHHHPATASQPSELTPEQRRILYGEDEQKK